MRIWTNEDDFDLGACVAVLGMFDGVHIGHQALIRRGIEIAKEENVPCVVYTFDRHPLSVICPEKEPKPLLSLSQKLDKIEKMGVSGVLIKPFTLEFAATQPEEFIRCLAEKMHIRALVAGFNFTFGDRGRGNSDTIYALSGKYGYRAEIIEAVQEGNQTVSSTLIRSLLSSGDIIHAQRLLHLRLQR